MPYGEVPMVKDNGTPYGWRESPPSTALHPTVCLTPGVCVKLVSLADLPGGAATGNAEEPAEEPAEAVPVVLAEMVEVVLLLQLQEAQLVIVKEEDQLLLLVETAVLQIEDKVAEVVEETQEVILEEDPV